VGQAWGGKLPHAYTVRKQISPDDRPLYALENPTLEVCIFFRLSLSVPTKKSRPKFQIPLNQDNNGDWESWLSFFANGVRETSDNAVETANQLIETMKQDRNEIQQRFPRVASSILRVHEVLSDKIVLPIIAISKESGISYPTVRKALDKLADLGMGKEVPGVSRNRTFVYSKYIRILNEGIDTE